MDILVIALSINPRLLSALELKLSGLIMESRVDTAGDNQNAHVIISNYHIFTVKYVLFTYAIQAQVLCTYRDTISRKLYQFKICQNPYLPREIWTHITPPYHTPNLESCISSKFVKIHISLGRYGLISHPHITPQTSYHISRDPHIRSALFYSIVRCKLFSIYKSNFCI